MRAESGMVAMEVVSGIAEVRAWRAGQREVGFVPTLGALHEGHLSLVRRARRESARVAVSIFVNPTQFSRHEDLARYPRPLEQDLRLLGAEAVDLVFVPSVETIYPPGAETVVLPGSIARRLEGRSRPGHFRGVATIVTKLFTITAPTRAYFGEKDAQQLRVVQALVRDLCLPVQIVACPTVREPDGLALSSRNVYLSAAERQAATVLWRALQAAATCWAGGERRGGALRATMRAVLDVEPRALVDYVSVADPDTLAELRRVEGEALASLSASIGATRLIDNLLLGPATSAAGAVLPPVG